MSLTDHEMTALSADSSNEASASQNAKPGRLPQPTSQQMAAYREAAHAVVLAYMTGASSHAEVVAYITTAASSNDVTIEVQNRPHQHHSQSVIAGSRAAAEEEVTYLLAGAVAEGISVNGEPPVFEEAFEFHLEHPSQDALRAWEILTLGPHFTDVEREHVAHRIYRRVKEILMRPSVWGAVRALAAELEWTSFMSVEDTAPFLAKTLAARRRRHSQRSDQPLGASEWRQLRLQHEEVRYIHSLRARGLTQKQIAQRLSVSRGCVAHILRGRTWRGTEPAVASGPALETVQP